MPAREDPEDGQGDRVVPPAQSGAAPTSTAAPRVRSMAAKVPSMEMGTMSTSPQSATRRRSKGSTSRVEFHGRISEECSRMWRGPKRAPGRYEQPPSKGMP